MSETDKREIDGLIASLSIRQRAAFTAGSDFWSVAGSEVHGIPSITVTDGPNGARGSGLLGTGIHTSLCVPCGSALGASWNPALLWEVGQALGREARTKGARVLLAPTVNNHRSPIAGRNFECYSEDPLLSGQIAAGFIGGVQTTGVAATVKHFIGNETEFKRSTSNSVIDQRALREIYAPPFEHAVAAGVWALMTSYNRVNGEWPAESRHLLGDLLRTEWGYDGVVMTDWFGVVDTALSSEAGIDLEMPGPGRRFGDELAKAVEHGSISAELLDEQVRRWFTLIDRVGAWEDILGGPVRSDDRPEDRAMARRAATEATVLVRNNGLLPLPEDDAPNGTAEGLTVCLIGANADRPQMMGGGSAQLRPHHQTSLREVLTQRYGDRLTFHTGPLFDRTLPPLAKNHLRVDGNRAISVEIFDNPTLSGPAVHSLEMDELRPIFSEDPYPGVDISNFSYRATCDLEVAQPGAHTFSLIQAGRARLMVDGEVLIDGIDSPLPPGTHFFGLGSSEAHETVDLPLGVVRVVVEYISESVMLHGCQVGYRPPQPTDPIAAAAEAARNCDVAIVMVGTSAEWETEGDDRTTMSLPGEQDALIEAVCQANPSTIVVVNAGSPVQMTWRDQPAAVLYAWLGGQEMAGALDDVLHGIADPSGRMPTSIPLTLEHNPSFTSFPGDNNTVAYAESVFVGYRWYQYRSMDVAVPFGHGGSYADVTWSQPTIDATEGACEPAFIGSDPVAATVGVTMTNTGDRRGTSVLQVYVRPVGTRLQRPVRELAGFVKVDLDAREETVVTCDLGARAFAYWDPGDPQDSAIQDHLPAEANLVPHGTSDAVSSTAGWRVDSGTYVVELGRSCEDIVHSLELDIIGSKGPR